jgi:hypothetical protein
MWRQVFSKAWGYKFTHRHTHMLVPSPPENWHNRPRVLLFISFFLYLFCSTGDWTPDLTHYGKCPLFPLFFVFEPGIFDTPAPTSWVMGLQVWNTVPSLYNSIFMKYPGNRKHTGACQGLGEERMGEQLPKGYRVYVGLMESSGSK